MQITAFLYLRKTSETVEWAPQSVLISPQVILMPTEVWEPLDLKRSFDKKRCFFPTSHGKGKNSMSVIIYHLTEKSPEMEASAVSLMRV